jgi:hypothetical protein
MTEPPRARTARRIADAIRITVPIAMTVWNDVERYARDYGMATAQYVRMIVVDHITAKRAEEEAAKRKRR